MSSAGMIRSGGSVFMWLAVACQSPASDPGEWAKELLERFEDRKLIFSTDEERGGVERFQIWVGVEESGERQIEWWLNGDGAHMPSAPRSSYFALGVGRSIIWMDPSLDLTVVARWIDRDQCDGFCAKVVAAM